MDNAAAPLTVAIEVKFSAVHADAAHKKPRTLSKKEINQKWIYTERVLGKDAVLVIICNR